MNYGEKSKYGVVTSWCTLKTDNIFESSKVMPYIRNTICYFYMVMLPSSTEIHTT